MQRLFKKIPQQKVSDKVFDQIRELITAGKLTPGEKLPPERELTTLFNVSRSSVREAILKLEVLGFIEQRHGEGTYVKSATEAPLMSAVGEFLKQAPFLADLLEIRTVLESWAADTAARRATDDEIEQMKACIREMKQRHTDQRPGKELNLCLHILIAQATHNTFLVHIMNTISDWIRQLTDSVHTVSYDAPDVFRQLLAQHEQIVAAIEKRNPQTALECMRTHLAYTREMVVRTEEKEDDG